MAVITEIEDLRRQAKKRVAKAIFGYVDSGSYTERTMRANRSDLDAIHLRQRVAVNVADRSTATTMAGETARMPLALAPVGLTGLNYGDGEILAAQAAEEFGVPFTLTTMSICSIEDVAAATKKPFWFQLYVMRDRGFAADLIARAKAARCSALVLTLDLQILGQRHADLRNGLTVPPRPTWSNLADMLRKPSWCASVLLGKRKTFGNLDGHVKGAQGLSTLMAWVGQQFDPTLSWDDVAWIRDQWDGKLILKGILDADDARLAARTGADAIVVSNHGGRQLDGAISSIRALPQVIDAVGDDRVEIWMDGGIRSGQDILKACAMGARGVMAGRSYIYGLGAMGKPGVALALDIMRKELDVSMALSGLRDIQAADRSHIVLPKDW
ncbi:alpha-hydroxy acid oxidase [Pseudoduganella buxea]|uniref:Alpha-hydroxy-acid oxidizing enzyme n=1 Tax=Pseudoduganella buxea TaxID=1949069 RepID=A0A6I3SRM9_9BURK|nr:alpha-hydroxy acid oxidase [Pseudoduganella buxea]MTV51741.1 L-lactate dehydrogenase [Pseudoduganella buxea]GGC11953.1 alpha-hydroxy-acid oxidizing enzyme [Pseudoduganella buxea]